MIPTIQLFGSEDERDQWVKDMLEKHRKRFEQGNRSSLIEAVAMCAENDILMPGWVSRAFLDCTSTVFSAEKRSWDDVFGAPHKKGRQPKATNKRNQNAFSVYVEVVKYLRKYSEDELKDAFDAVAEERGNISAGTVKRYYYECKRYNDQEKRFADNN